MWPNGGFLYLLLFDLNDTPHPLCGTPVSGFNPRCSTVDWDKISQYLDFADLSLNEKLDINLLLQIQLHVLNLSHWGYLHVYVFFLQVRQIQYFLCLTNWIEIWKILEEFQYRKVTSSNTSRLEAPAGFFRLLMKEILDPYVLWPFDKKLISSLVTRVRTRNYNLDGLFILEFF